jgi:hypothetical protein
VAPAVTGKKYQEFAVILAEEQFIGGIAKGRFDALPAFVLQFGDVVHPAAAYNSQ